MIALSNAVKSDLGVAMIVLGYRFTLLLAGAARQPVIDQTGLRDAFDFTLDLTPPADDPLQTAARTGVTLAADPTNGFGRIAEAVENQLGLKLESRKIPVEMLIIDHVERPSEN